MAKAPTLQPNEVLIKVLWTALPSRDLIYRSHGWLSRTHTGLGHNYSGTVVGVGSRIKHVEMGDQVFGCVFESPAHNAVENDGVFLTAPGECVAKLPANIPLRAAATIPSSFVAAFESINSGLGLSLPRPSDQPNARNPNSNSLQLVWGAGCAAGEYAIQLLKYYGFNNRFAVSAKKYHTRLLSIGATHVFDQADPTLMHCLFAATLGLNHGSCPPGRFVIDFLASKEQSLSPIAALSNPGARVAVMTPVIGEERHRGEERDVLLDPLLAAHWRFGVAVKAVRPDIFNSKKYFNGGLQSQIMAELAADSVIAAAEFTEVTGATVSDRVKNAMDLAETEGIEGRSFVWRVNED